MRRIVINALNVK